MGQSLKQEKNTVIQARHTLDFLFSRNQHDSALTQARKTYSQGHNCLVNWRSAVGISQYTREKPQGEIFSVQVTIYIENSEKRLPAKGPALNNVPPSLAGKITKSRPHGMKNLPPYRGKLSIFILLKLPHFHCNSCKKISQYLNLIFWYFVPKMSSIRPN